MWSMSPSRSLWRVVDYLFSASRQMVVIRLRLQVILPFSTLMHCDWLPRYSIRLPFFILPAVAFLADPLKLVFTTILQNV